ncbi:MULTISPECIES: hypothetical protein [Paenibacillus]|uniref:hypothetical protein n=1 Tax=Paenibacillus TaxID=44249 RepID=UPI0022B90BE7|nr:hypothetical protein [Paenibacillus caseinilyticus]MCZ8520182.1 hypothetical protein [Paenibacillus caseinilyticus]
MSKKLQGNGRWESSRMMLPEHRAQLIERQRIQSGEAPAVRAQMPTKEELELIRDYTLLPMMLTIVEKNRIQMELSTVSMKKLYVTALHALMRQIHMDLVLVKKSLRERSIKVYDDEAVDSAIHYRYVCRGYEDRLAMTRDVVRSEISVRLARYVAGLFRQEEGGV